MKSVSFPFFLSPFWNRFLSLSPFSSRTCTVFFLFLFSLVFLSQGVPPLYAGEEESEEKHEEKREEKGEEKRDEKHEAENVTEEWLPVWDEEKVTILANQGEEPVAFELESARGAQRVPYTLRPGETRAVSNPQSAAAVFLHGKDPVRLTLAQDQIYVFVKQEGVWELFGIGPEYGTEPPKTRVQGPESAKNGASGTAQERILRIPVVIYTDENIPLAEALWRRRVAQRLEAASAVLEKTCFLRFEIREFKSWKSDPRSASLPEVLKDFETQIPAEPGVLAMGFTAHKNSGNGPTELGVARQPFCGRILLREEAPQITEVERLETLLHEVGHFLGAVHTSDENSVMRTVLHERHARDVNFVIGFDPLNALAMNLWCRQYLRGDGKRLRTIHPDILAEMEAVYLMVKRIADDQRAAGVQISENPNVEAFLKLLAAFKSAYASVNVQTAAAPEPASPETQAEAASPEPVQESVPESVPSETPSETVAGTPSETPKSLNPVLKRTEPLSNAEILRGMLKEMTQEPWEPEETKNFSLPVRTTRYVLVRTLLALEKNEPLRGLNTDGKTAGDVLGERIVRYAAWASLEVGGTGAPDSVEGKAARRAFLLACEIFLEPSGAINSVPVYGRRFRVIETPEIKEMRQKIVGTGVSVFGREDHSMHFWLSAALVTQMIPSLVENIGVEKEIRDDRPGGSGFDVTDLNADLAGTWFADRVLKGEIPLEDIGKSFDYTLFVPAKIRIPKRLKHPKDTEEIQELLDALRKGVQELKP